jgi:hypothetical protein
MLRDIGNSVMMPIARTLYIFCDEISVIKPPSSYPYGTMNFMPALGIRILIANS